jgi:plastocyanin
MIRKRRGHLSRLRQVFGFVLALGVGVVLGGGRSARAADVKGRLVGFEHLRNPVWVAAKDPGKHGYSFREPVTTVPAAMRKLFPQISKEICVVALSTGGAAGAGKPVSVRVSGGRTTPTTLVVTPGTELRFKNADPFEHRLYGVGFATLAASATAKGALRRWTPQDAGRYEIRDELSPSLLMWVVAEPTAAAMAFPAADGRFVIALEQPGQYMIQAYFAGEAVGRPLPVTVDKRDLDMSRQPLVLATKPPVEDNTP